jgi:ubiquinone/menaquinone biosynthesis C-methylase UbiE
MSNENHVCSHEHAKWLDNDIRRMLQNPRRMFGRWIEPGASILDIGCGPGTFTLDLARMAGPQGKVIAIDIQEQMLTMAREKIAKAGLLDRVQFHRCSGDKLGISTQADFILTFYMVHEAPHPLDLIDQICSLLSSGGYYFLAEPKMHVSKLHYDEVVTRCEKNGLTAVSQYGIISRYAIFKKT